MEKKYCCTYIQEQRRYTKYCTKYWGIKLMSQDYKTMRETE